MPDAKFGYTLVRHEAFDRDHPEFEFCTVVASVPTAKHSTSILANGGISFDSYEEAEAFSMKANYPEGTEGIIAACRGSFSAKVKITGRPIYIPLRMAIG